MLGTEMEACVRLMPKPLPQLTCQPHWSNRVLERYGLLERVAVVQGRPRRAFDPDLLKPSPALLQRVATVLNCPPGTWYIGDDSIDIEAAHAAGMRAAGVATGHYSEDDLGNMKADLVASSFNLAVQEIVVSAD